MKTPTKIITALALAGIAVAGGSAFTAAAGLTDSQTAHFIGGSVAQSITGGTLATTTYTYDATSLAGPTVTAAALTFTSASVGKTVHASFTPAAAPGTPVVFTCDVTVPDISFLVTCTNATGVLNPTTLKVTVAES